MHAAEQDREDVNAAREAWRRDQASLMARRLVFIDETATTTNMTRLRSRALKGELLIAKTPHGHRKNTTFIAALRCGSITGPMVLDGPMNGAIFPEYVRQVLAPTLTPGDFVIMDNLPGHKIFGVEVAIRVSEYRSCTCQPVRQT
jgi:hypothetical protein